MVAEQAERGRDARLEDAGDVFARAGELGAFGFQQGDERVLAVAGDEEGVVVREEREEVGEAEVGGLGGVGGGVDGGDAGGGTREECVLDLVLRVCD